MDKQHDNEEDMEDLLKSEDNEKLYARPLLVSLQKIVDQFPTLVISIWSAVPYTFVFADFSIA